MKDLIEAGYVYIAKPPLYKLKQGKRERYLEHEAELEECPAPATSSSAFSVLDAQGHGELKLTENRWQLLHAAAGSSTRAGRVSLRRRARPRPRPCSSRSRRCSTRASRPCDAALRVAPCPRGSEGQTFETKRSKGEDDQHLIVRGGRDVALVSRGRTACARGSYFESRGALARLGPRARASCVELAGTPPFVVSLGRRTIARRCSSFEALRDAGPLPSPSKGVKLHTLQGPRRDERRAAATRPRWTRLAERWQKVNVRRRAGRGGAPAFACPG